MSFWDIVIDEPRRSELERSCTAAAAEAHLCALRGKVLSLHRGGWALYDRWTGKAKNLLAFDWAFFHAVRTFTKALISNSKLYLQKYLHFVGHKNAQICKFHLQVNCQTHFFEYHPVWPEKNRQMSVEVAQKWFHYKNDRF